MSIMKKFFQGKGLSRMEKKVKSSRGAGLHMEPLEDRLLLSAAPNDWGVLATLGENENINVRESGKTGDLVLAIPTQNNAAGEPVDVLVGLIVSAKDGTLNASQFNPGQIKISLYGDVEYSPLNASVVKKEILDYNGTQDSLYLLNLKAGQEYLLRISGEGGSATDFGNFVCTAFLPGDNGDNSTENTGGNGLIDNREMVATSSHLACTQAFFRGNLTPATIDVYYHFYGIDVTDWTSVYHADYDVDMDGMITTSDVNYMQNGLKTRGVTLRVADDVNPEIELDTDNEIGESEGGLPVFGDANAITFNISDASGIDTRTIVIKDKDGNEINDFIIDETDPLNVKVSGLGDADAVNTNGVYTFIISADDIYGNQSEETTFTFVYLADKVLETGTQDGEVTAGKSVYLDAEMILAGLENTTNASMTSITVSDRKPDETENTSTAFDLSDAASWTDHKKSFETHSGATVVVTCDDSATPNILSVEYFVQGRWNQNTNLADKIDSPVQIVVLVGYNDAAGDRVGTDYTYDFNVVGVNDAPTGGGNHTATLDLSVAVVAPVYDDSATSLNLTADVHDVDGDTLSFVKITGPVLSNTNGNFTLEEGAVTIAANGTVTLNTARLTEDFKALGLGQKETITYTYKVQDPSEKATDTVKTFTITIIGKNDVPTAGEVTAALDLASTTVTDGVKLDWAAASEDIDLGETATLVLATVNGTAVIATAEAPQTIDILADATDTRFAEGTKVGYVQITVDAAGKQTATFLANEEALKWTLASEEEYSVPAITYTVKDVQDGESAAGTMTVTITGAFDALEFENVDVTTGQLPAQEANVNAQPDTNGHIALDSVTFKTDKDAAGYTFSVDSAISTANEENDIASKLGFDNELAVFGVDGSVSFYATGLASDDCGEYTVMISYSNGLEETDENYDAGTKTFTLTVIGYSLVFSPESINAGSLTEDTIYDAESENSSLTGNIIDRAEVTVENETGLTVTSYDINSIELTSVASNNEDRVVPELSTFAGLMSVDFGGENNGDYTFKFDSASTFNFLKVGETLTLTYTFTVNHLVLNDGTNDTTYNGTFAGGKITVTITGVNDAPVAGDNVAISISENAASAAADSKVADPDGDTLSYEQSIYPERDADGGFVSLRFVDANDSQGEEEADAAYQARINEKYAAMIPAGTSFETWLTDAFDATTGKYVYTFAPVDDATTEEVDESAIFNQLPAGASAVLTYTYTVSDGNGGETTETIDVTITGQNDAPEASDFSTNVNVGTENTAINWASNVSDVDVADTQTLVKITVEGTEYTVPAADSTKIFIHAGTFNQGVEGEEAGVTGQADGALGFLTLASDGSVTFTATGDYLKWRLAAGDTFTFAFTYNVADSQNAGDSATATIVVAGADDDIDIASTTDVRVMNQATADAEGWVKVTTSPISFNADPNRTYTFEVTSVNGSTDKLGTENEPNFKLVADENHEVWLYVRKSAMEDETPVFAVDEEYELQFAAINASDVDEIAEGDLNTFVLTVQAKTSPEVHSDVLNDTDSSSNSEDVPSVIVALGNQAGLITNDDSDGVTAPESYTFKTVRCTVATLNNNNATELYENILDQITAMAKISGTFVLGNTTGTGEFKLLVKGYTGTDGFNFDQLAADDHLVLTFEFTVEDDTYGTTAPGTFALKFAGVNDAPTWKAETTGEEARVYESTSIEEEEGQTKTLLPASFVKDIDSTTFYFASVTAEDATYGEWVNNQQVITLSSGATLTLTRDVDENITSALYDVTGRVNRDANLDKDATATDVISFTVCDDSGESTASAHDYTFNIVGVNDLPYLPQDSQPASIAVADTQTTGSTGESSVWDRDSSATLYSRMNTTPDKTEGTGIVFKNASGEITGNERAEYLAKLPNNLADMLTAKNNIVLRGTTGMYTFTAEAVDGKSPFEFLPAGVSVELTYAFQWYDVDPTLPANAEAAGVTETVVVTITGSNQEPVAVDSNNVSAMVDLRGDGTILDVSGESPVVVDLTGVFTDAEDAATDLTAEVKQDSASNTSYPAGALIANNGQLAFSQDGLAALRTAFASLADGVEATFTLTYTVTDTDGGVSAAKTIDVTIVGKNDAPVANDFSAGEVNSSANKIVIKLADGTDQYATDVDDNLDTTSIMIQVGSDYTLLSAGESLTLVNGATVELVHYDEGNPGNHEVGDFLVYNFTNAQKVLSDENEDVSIWFKAVDTSSLESEVKTISFTIIGDYEAPEFTVIENQTGHMSGVELTDGETSNGIVEINLYDYLNVKSGLTFKVAKSGTGQILADNTGENWYTIVNGVLTISMMAQSNYNIGFDLSKLTITVTATDAMNISDTTSFDLSLAEQYTATIQLRTVNTLTEANEDTDLATAVKQTPGMYGEDDEENRLLYVNDQYVFNNTNTVSKIGTKDGYYIEIWVKNIGEDITSGLLATALQLKLHYDISTDESVNTYFAPTAELGSRNKCVMDTDDNQKNGDVYIQFQWSDFNSYYNSNNYELPEGWSVLSDGDHYYRAGYLKVTSTKVTNFSVSEVTEEEREKIGQGFVKGWDFDRLGPSVTTSGRVDESQVQAFGIVLQPITGYSSVEVVKDGGVYVRTVADATAGDWTERLGNNDDFFHEWQTHYAEVWVKTSELEQYRSTTLNLNFNKDVFSVVDVDFGSAFNDGEFSVDAENGQIAIYGVSSEGASANGYTLLARVKFESGEGQGIAWSESMAPQSLGVSIADAFVTLADGTLWESYVGKASTTELWANPYDVDDNGRIDADDYTPFSGVYGSVSTDSGFVSKYLDFNRDGRIDADDYTYFSSIYGVSKSDVVSGAKKVLFPKSFTQRYIGTTLGADNVELVGTVLDTANAAWVEVLGLNEAISVTLVVKDLGGDTLALAQSVKTDESGMTTNGIIYLDDNAAGNYWYSQMAAPVDASRYDLYTVLLHELGHLYGYDSTSDAYIAAMENYEFLASDGHSTDTSDVMYRGIEVGERKELTENDIDAASAILAALTGETVGSGSVSAIVGLGIDSPAMESAGLGLSATESLGIETLASPLAMTAATRLSDSAAHAAGYLLEKSTQESLLALGLEIGNATIVGDGEPELARDLILEDYFVEDDSDDDSFSFVQKSEKSYERSMSIDAVLDDLDSI